MTRNDDSAATIPAPAAQADASGGTLRPEQELLILSARLNLEDKSAERFRHLCSGTMDWDYLIAEALYQGQFPIVHHHLNRLAPESIPPGVRDIMFDHARSISRSNLLLISEMARLSGMFRDAGVSMLVFKGPALTAMVYGHLLLREFYDLDLLVKTADLDRAGRLLETAGYHRTDTMSPAEEKRVLATGMHFSYEGEDPRAKVELHWTTADRNYALSRDVAYLWDRAVSVPVGGVDVLTLSPEDMLLMLCAHGARHDWARMRWVMDVAEFLRRFDDLDWGRVRSEARLRGGERLLLIGLGLAHKLLNAPVPDEVRQDIAKDRKITEAVGEAIDLLFRHHDFESQTVLRTHRFRLGLRERWGSRLWYVLKYLAPQHEGHDYPDGPASRGVWRIVLRPLRVLARLANSATHRSSVPARRNGSD